MIRSSVSIIVVLAVVLAGCGAEEKAPAGDSAAANGSGAEQQAGMAGAALAGADASSSSALPAGTKPPASSVTVRDTCGVPGPLVDMLAASVRERFPTVATVRVFEVRSQRWGMKHLAVTLSTSGDGRSVIGVHAISGTFGSVLKTLDVFVGSSDDFPVIHRVAGDSVVVVMEPEKGDPRPDARRAYEWRSVEGQ